MNFWKKAEEPEPKRLASGAPVYPSSSFTFTLPFETSMATQKPAKAIESSKAAKPGPFGGYGFAAGSVAGLRSFRVDVLGRLTGVTVKQIWTPGENVASCRPPSSLSMTISNILYSSTYGSPPDPEPTTPVESHDLAGCACGFYAYFDGCNDYADATTVAGVIEGYGKTTIGSRGFRCEKAKIVALVIPATRREKHPGKLKGTDLRPALLDRVQRNYPDLAIFASEYDMTSEFPVTDESSTPTSDPEFWTRRIS